MYNLKRYTKRGHVKRYTKRGHVARSLCWLL